MIILVIGGLGILATIKYQTQKSNGIVLANSEALAQDSETEERAQQDVAIVMVDEEASDENSANENTKSKAK